MSVTRDVDAPDSAQSGKTRLDDGGDMDPHGHVGVIEYSEVRQLPNISVSDADRVSRNLVLST